MVTIYIFMYITFTHIHTRGDRRDGGGKTANLYAHSPHGTTPPNDGSISAAT